MDYTLIVSNRPLISHFHTPDASSQRLFHTVLRAGHLKTAPDYAVERASYRGHDLILCLAGRGFVRSGGKSFAVMPGQMVWIDCRLPHAHWADPGAPWELFWLRAGGKATGASASALKVVSQPVFELHDRGAAMAQFERVFALLAARPLALDAALHAAMAELIALLFQARLAEPLCHEPDEADLRLNALITRMRYETDRAWRVKELAALAGLSAPHFYRRFRKATGSTPVDWLRHQRINDAKQRLSQSRASIRVIAEELGYRDPFYFSRDFKKLVGLSPRDWRRQEMEARRRCY
jgi:AraC-like DNA-binding protein